MKLKRLGSIITTFIAGIACLFTVGCTISVSKFKVNFFVDNEVYATIETAGEEAIQMPEDPTKNGYIFEGWFLDYETWQNQFTADSLLSTSLSNDLNVYSKWINEDLIKNTDISLNSFHQDNETTFSLVVPNATDSLSLNQYVTVSERSVWALSDDLAGNEIISNKTVELTEGDNSFYIVVTAQNGDKKTYTINIRRKMMYNITFDANGGSPVNNQTIEEGTIINEPTTSRDGYTFVSWGYDFTNPINSNLYLTATWDLNRYKINYDANGGEVSSSFTSVDYGSEYTLLTPTREGYLFTGWYNGNELVTDGTYNYLSDITLTASWTDEYECDEEFWNGKKWVALGTSITATRDTNGDGKITGQYPNTLEELSGLVQTNYGVEGANLGGHPLLYSLINNYRSSFVNADIITVEGGVNDWFGGKPLGTIEDTMPYYNDWTKGGINLVTGYKNGTFAGSCYTLFTHLKNLNPNAMIVALTDCAGPDGGSCAGNRTNSKGLYLSDYNEMMMAVAEQVGIKAIDVGSECGITGQDSQYFSDHVHLNAAGGEIYANYVWNKLLTFTKKIHTDKEKVTVTFKTNGETINTQTIEKGGSVYSPNPGTYGKRDFVSYDHSLKGITSDTVINSVWTENRTTISFNTDGGTVMNDIADFPGEPVGEIVNPTKDGYIFDGWDKELPSVYPNQDLTLTALWREEDNLFARLDETKGTMMMYSDNNTPVEYSHSAHNLSDYIPVNGKKLIIEFDVDTVSTASTYTQTNFNIAPFYSTSGSAPQYSIYYETYSSQNEYMTVSRDDTHYVITWTGYNYIRISYVKSKVHNISIKYATYDVSFSDGENVISTQKVVYGEDAIAPETPTKDGYIFDGWDKSFTNVKKDLVVTARWKDEDELFDSTQILNNTFLNSTVNGTANGYKTSNYFACNYNHKLRIDVTRTSSALGDFRIALGTSNNNSYLGAWQVGSTSTLFDENGVYNGPHLKIVKEVVDNHTYLVITNKNTDMHYVRLSYQGTYISSISVKVAD